MYVLSIAHTGRKVETQFQAHCIRLVAVARVRACEVNENRREDPAGANCMASDRVSVGLIKSVST